ncbi:MAG TPA: hypothetical protein PLV45_19050, partial [bacterium]|nr:hypothetical protein [bacterium]
IRILHRDVRKLHDVFRKASFDLITVNPPFFPIHRDHQGTSGAEKNARQEILGSLRFFLQAANYLGSTRSDLYIIYHPSRLDYLFREVHRTEFTCKELQFIHHQDGRALFVLVHCLKGGGDGVRVLPPCFIQETLKAGFKEE